MLKGILDSSNIKENSKELVNSKVKVLENSLNEIIKNKKSHFSKRKNEGRYIDYEHLIGQK
jgi:hypothetical protein